MNDDTETSDLEKVLQQAATGATPRDLGQLSQAIKQFNETVRGGDHKDDDLAALILRLARHYHSPPQTPSDNAAADGHVVPQSVGRFRIERELGSGGFGIVYLAYDASVERQVAIKLPRRDIARDSSKRDQLLFEARAAGALNHPNIVAIYEAAHVDGTTYIASAFCDGPDLADWLVSQDTRSTHIEVALFVAKLAHAVSYAHSHGIIHRDIKPSNVLLSPVEPLKTGQGSSETASEDKNARRYMSLSHYEPKLTDFGLAKVTAESITDSRSSCVLGTPLYMAPEQILPTWGAVTVRTDIYSLGVLLVELLDGKPVWLGKTFSDIVLSLQGDQEPADALKASNVPRDLQTIASKCLARAPEDRYESASAFASDLEAFVQGEPISARKFTRLDSLANWCRNPKRTSEACVFSMALNVIMAIWVMFSMWVVLGPLYPGSQGDSGRGSVVSQGIALTLGFSLPMVLLAWLRLRGHRWAIYIAFVVTLIMNVIVPMLVIVGFPVIFGPMYDGSPYFRVVINAQVLFFGIMQSLLYSIAIFSDRFNARRFQQAG